MRNKNENMEDAHHGKQHQKSNGIQWSSKLVTQVGHSLATGRMLAVYSPAVTGSPAGRWPLTLWPLLGRPLWHNRIPLMFLPRAINRERQPINGHLIHLNQTVSTYGPWTICWFTFLLAEVTTIVSFWTCLLFDVQMSPRENIELKKNAYGNQLSGF